MEIATKHQTYLIGIRNQSGAKADDYVKTIIDTVSDRNNSSSLSGGQESILNNISNTMANRCISNACIDDKLAEQIKPLNYFSVLCTRWMRWHRIVKK